MKECERIKELLSEYLDGILTDEQAERVKAHTNICKNCHKELEELKQISLALKRLPKGEPPEDFVERVHSRIEKRKNLNFFLREIFSVQNIKVPVMLAFMVVLVFGLFKISDRFDILKQPRSRQYERVEEIADKDWSMSSRQAIISKEKDAISRERYSPKSGEFAIATGGEALKRLDEKADYNINRAADYSSRKLEIAKEGVPASDAIELESKILAVKAIPQREGSRKELAAVGGTAVNGRLFINTPDIATVYEKVKNILEKLNIKTVSSGELRLQTPEQKASSFRFSVNISKKDLDALIEEIDKIVAKKIVYDPPKIQADDFLVLTIDLETSGFAAGKAFSLDEATSATYTSTEQK